MTEPALRGSWFPAPLGLLLGVSLLHRFVYVLAQAEHDVFWNHPRGDGEVYWAWGQALADGRFEGAGAFYLAPLYPQFLGLVFRAFGPEPFAVYTLQQLLSVATGLAVFLVTSRTGSTPAAYAAAGLALFAQPFVYFSSQPVAEILGIALLVWALACFPGGSRGSVWGGGVLGGLAVVARPSFLPVVILWGLYIAYASDRRRGLTFLIAVMLPIVPVAAVNYARSGHLVLVSANSGATLYHGNARGANGGYTKTPEFSGDPLFQQNEATSFAVSQSGRSLDAVQADKHFRKRAMTIRAESPVSSMFLLLTRVLFLVDHHEYGLNFSPDLDTNPWRSTRGQAPPFPPWFALIFGLAITALIFLGPRAAGGRAVWLAILALTLVPLVFYDSSRYRLPLTLFLSIPAGIGLSAVALGHPRIRSTWALATLAAALLFSLVLAPAALPVFRQWTLASANPPVHGPVLDRRRFETVSRRVARSRLLFREGKFDDALAEIQPALLSSIAHPPMHYLHGEILREKGDRSGAIRAYRMSLQIDPAFADSAAELAHLEIENGNAASVRLRLRKALEHRPGHLGCMYYLIQAHLVLGEIDSARAVGRRARSAGVKLDAQLLELIQSLDRSNPDGDRP